MNKILKASAGTGKTYRLSLEYVAALLQGEEFEEIVVMTFTRKATAELRERIIEHIEDILENSYDSEVFNNLSDIYGDIKLNLTSLKNIYRTMLENKDSINIYTIDSFINRLFNQAIAPYLGIYNYEIIESGKNEEIIESVFKEILDNPEDFKLMETFLSEDVERDIDRYIELIKKMLANRWKFLLIDPRERSPKKVEALVPLLDRCINDLKEIAFVKGNEFTEEYFIKAFRNILVDYQNFNDRDQKQELIIKHYDKFFQDSFWNGTKIRGENVAVIRENLAAGYQNFREQLANYFYNQKMISYETEIFNFFQRIFAIYDRIKLKEKVFTHNDISNYTYKFLYRKELGLLAGQAVSDYFFDLIGTRVKSLFIDEFQDTSILQWKILKPLIDKCETVISVGDEKQSIYGWRGGEKELFSRLDKILTGNKETLNICYRSEREITEFVNRFFQNLDLDWNYEEVSHLSEKNEGYVEVLLGGDKAKINTNTKAFQRKSEEKQQEIKNLNQKIKENLPAEIARTIKNNFSNYNNIGVLARTGNDLNAIVIELDKRNIPYVLESQDSLIEHKAVQPLYFLLKYLTYNDFFQLFKFLRSDLVGINSMELKFLLQNKQELEEFMNEREEEENNFDVNIPEITLDIKEVLYDIKRLKKKEYQKLTNYIINNSGLLDLYRENSGALKNIYFFFEKMKEFGCLNEFMTYLEENKESEELKQVGVKEENAVQLMTIHKAKGLSFATEFFYWSPKMNNHSWPDKMKIYLDFDNKFQTVKDYLLTDSRYEKLFQYLDIDFAARREKKELMEEINNVYVALTRPEKNLFFYLEAPRRLKTGDKKCWAGSSYDFYENAVLSAAGVSFLKDLVERKKLGKLTGKKEKQNIQKVDISDLSKFFSVPEINENKLTKINENKDFTMDLEREIKRIEGLAVHYYLEHIKYNKPREKEFARSMVLAKYGNILGPKKTAEVIKKVRSFIDRNQYYFDDSWQVFTEYELETKSQNFRIDRLLVNKKEKEILILDYKTGETKEQSQLDKYKEIVNNKIGDANYKVKTEFLEVY